MYYKTYIFQTVPRPIKQTYIFQIILIMYNYPCTSTVGLDHSVFLLPTWSQPVYEGRLNVALPTKYNEPKINETSPTAE